MRIREIIVNEIARTNDNYFFQTDLFEAFLKSCNGFKVISVFQPFFYLN